MFEVRFAREEDAESILEITREAFLKYKEMSGATKLAALEETVADVKKDIADKIVLVAVSEGETVGCVRLEIRDHIALLTRFAVKVSSQNNGIGKSIMNHIDKILIKRGVKSVYLYTASNVASLIRFYYGRGFYVESTDKESGYIRARLVKEYSGDVKNVQNA